MSSEVKIIVNAETRAAAAALKNTTDGMNQLLGRTGVARDALQTFQRVANLIGFQAAPQLTGAVYLASDSWKTLSGTMKLAGLGAGATGLAIAGITATVATGVFALQAYKAKWDEIRKAQALVVSEGKANLRYGEIILDAEAAGKITSKQSEGLMAGVFGELNPAEKKRQGELLAINKSKGGLDDAQIDELNSIDSAVAKRKHQAVKILMALNSNDAEKKAVASITKAQEEMSLAKLADFEKEKAEAILAKAERFKAIEEEMAKFESDQHLKTALIDSGRAKEEVADVTRAGFKKQLQNAADGEFQARMATADAAEQARKDADWQAREQEAIKRFQLKERELQAERDLVERFQREQEMANDEALRREAMRKNKQIGDIQADPFLTNAEKYQQSKDAGADMTGSVDPNSTWDNMRANMTALKDQFGTFSQGAAALVTNGIGSAIQGVSDGIMGMIDGTRTWAETWGSVMKSMAAQGIDFIVKQTAMFVLNKGKQLAVHIATESGMTATSLGQSALRMLSSLKEAGIWVVKTAVKAASSVADIPYVGWALAIAALGGVLAAGKSAIDGARADGGPVDAGGTYLVGERGPELFVPRQRGDILSNPETMRRMSTSGAEKSSGAAGDVKVSVANFIVANLDELVHRAMELPRGTKIIAQTIDGRRLDLGFDT